MYLKIDIIARYSLVEKYLQWTSQYPQNYACKWDAETTYSYLNILETKSLQDEESEIDKIKTVKKNIIGWIKKLDSVALLKCCNEIIALERYFSLTGKLVEISFPNNLKGKVVADILAQEVFPIAEEVFPIAEEISLIESITIRPIVLPTIVQDNIQHGYDILVIG